MFPIKWLLVEWETRVGFMPQYGLVHIRSLVGPTNELHTGKMIFVASGNGEMKQAKVVMSSDDRRFLEQQLISIEEHSQQVEAAAEACRAALAAQEMAPSPKPQLGMDLKTHIQSAGISSWSPENDTNSQSESDSEPGHQTYKFKRGGNQFPNRVKSDKSSVMNLFKHASSSSRGTNGTSRMDTPAPYDQRRQYRTESNILCNPYSKKQRGNDCSIMTYDQGTQTRPTRFHQVGMRNIPKIEEKVSDLERVIEEMEEKFANLEATIDNWIVAPGSPDGFRETSMPLQEVYGNISHIENVNSQSMVERQRIRDMKTRESTPEMSESDVMSTNDMVGIGTGQTMVPRHIINQVDWNSYTMATRKLLMAVFPRRTLATHSLTGKSSPAFMNKPAKLCLDPIKVNDIVMAVTENCNVKESLVRSSITTKCADENKMFRMRQEKYGKKQKAEKRNDFVNGIDEENVLPQTPTLTPLETGNP